MLGGLPGSGNLSYTVWVLGHVFFGINCDGFSAKGLRWETGSGRGQSVVWAVEKLEGRVPLSWLKHW